MLAALQHILTTLGFHEDVSVFIVLFGLIFARLVSAITLTPFLGKGRLSEDQGWPGGAHQRNHISRPGAASESG